MSKINQIIIPLSSPTAVTIGSPAAAGQTITCGPASCGSPTWSSSTANATQAPEPRDAYAGLNFMLVCIGLSVLILSFAHVLRGAKARRR